MINLSQPCSGKVVVVDPLGYKSNLVVVYLRRGIRPNPPGIQQDRRDDHRLQAVITDLIRQAEASDGFMNSIEEQDRLFPMGVVAGKPPGVLKLGCWQSRPGLFWAKLFVFVGYYFGGKSDSPAGHWV